MSRFCLCKSHLNSFRNVKKQAPNEEEGLKTKYNPFHKKIQTGRTFFF